MNARRPLKRSFAVAALGLLMATANGLAADGVAESFDRMLAHQPAPSAPVTGADRSADPLQQAMVVRLYERSQSPSATAVDPVAESFARMLAHTPDSRRPSVPTKLGPDPLFAAIAVPVRQWLAESATTPRLASTPLIGSQH